MCLLLAPAGAAANTTFRRHAYDGVTVELERFNIEWENTYRFYVDGRLEGELVFGYDTDYIDEDYAWSKGKYKSTHAELKRADDGSGNSYDTSNHSSSEAVAGEYSKCEKQHITNNVYYWCVMHYDYINIGGYSESDFFYGTEFGTNERDY